MKSANHNKLRTAAIILASACFIAESTAQVFYRPAPPLDSQPPAPAPAPLLTRKFEIDAAKFKEHSTNSDHPISARQLSAFLAKEGILFPSQFTDSDLPAWANLGKAFFYNDRLATLWVRASKDDLEKIDSALRPISIPHVNLSVRFVEYSDADSQMMGEESPIFGGPRKITWPSFTNTTFTIVLTEPQFRVAINAIENKEGVDLLTAPQVTTLSGRQARLSVENARNVSPQTPPPLPRDTSPDADPTPATLFKERTLKIPGL
jgi:hypothetical protein